MALHGRTLRPMACVSQCININRRAGRLHQVQVLAEKSICKLLDRNYYDQMYSPTMSAFTMITRLFVIQTTNLEMNIEFDRLAYDLIDLREECEYINSHAFML